VGATLIHEQDIIAFDNTSGLYHGDDIVEKYGISFRGRSLSHGKSNSILAHCEGQRSLLRAIGKRQVIGGRKGSIDHDVLDGVG